MEDYKYPFTAILGQNKMKLGLILNVIDPEIGGVLLTGEQGTGKSTAVRSLVEVLPNIETYKNCTFNCNPEKKDEFLCPSCLQKEKKNELEKYEKEKELINLPLGATAEMVIGSINVEKIIKEGIKSVDPGLIARAHRGLLYVDEINLLPDHLVDILLDVSASKVNLIEREGISYKHPANFVLIGSMNPEEGELRPQISDRLGLEIGINAPEDPGIRSKITKRVIEFSDNPQNFCKRFEEQQATLQEKIRKAMKKIKTITIEDYLYEMAAQMALKIGLRSQRADITLIRCARAHAAFEGRNAIAKEDVEQSLDLVFSHRLKDKKTENELEFLGNTFEEIWHKIPKDVDYDTKKSNVEPGNQEKYKSNTFKASKKSYKKFRETKLTKENYDLPELDGKSQKYKKQKNRYSNANLDEGHNVGYKAGRGEYTKKIKQSSSKIDFTPLDPRKRPLSMDFNIENFIKSLKKVRKITTYAGRGNRVKIMSRSTGTKIFSMKPRGMPHKIDIYDSIKSQFLHSSKKRNLEYKSRKVVKNRNLLQNKEKPNLISNLATEFKSNAIQKYDNLKNNTQKGLSVQLELGNIKEKVYELHAPLSLYFIIDASASMKRTLKQINKVIRSVHSEGYTKKDKVSLISFQGREVEVLQRPSVSVSVGLQRLKKMEATSFTPLASALHKTISMINQEKIKGVSIPVIIIMSDLGANVSKKDPDLNAQTNQDFLKIANELKSVIKKIAKLKIKVVIMKPKKSFATRFLGIHPLSAKIIQNTFEKNGAFIFEFNASKTDVTISRLKNILK